jgi:hypothetical protein
MDATVPAAAIFDLQRRQANFPPWHDLPWRPEDGTVRVTPNVLIDMLPTVARLEFFSAIKRAVLGAFEIGVAAPNAETEHYDDGSIGIRVNSGLIDFVYAVNRVLFGGTNMFSGQGVETPAPLQQNDVARRLAALYGQWQRGSLWRGERLVIEGFTLPEEQKGRAEHLARTTMLFFMCHEMGHAALHTEIAAEDRSPAQEFEADAFGFSGAILGYGKAAKDVRMAIAGAAVAVRALAALAVLGHRFPGVHPPPVARLGRLRWKLHGMCPDPRAFFHFSTIAFGYEEQMDAAERLMRGEAGRTAATSERLVSRLYACLEETANERQSASLTEAIFMNDVRDARRASLVRAGRLAAQVFSFAPPNPPRGQQVMFDNMRDQYASLVASLPLATRDLFTPQAGEK